MMSSMLIGVPPMRVISRENSSNIPISPVTVTKAPPDFFLSGRKKVIEIRVPHGAESIAVRVAFIRYFSYSSSAMGPSVGLAVSSTASS